MLQGPLDSEATSLLSAFKSKVKILGFFYTYMQANQQMFREVQVAQKLSKE